jgi:hypothetical protein
MKTLMSLIHEADIKYELWLDISIDQQALKDRDKTKNDALMLVNYFEGRRDALRDVHRTLEI